MYLIIGVGLILTALPAALGLGFGVRALKTIRESKPAKRGFLRAMSGTLAWPVVLVFGLTAVLVHALFRLVGFTDDGLFVVVLILVGLAASTVLIRRVAKWAKGSASDK
jgi:RsiW-degrading membrane proteinase PrsW (M82 family)